MIKYLRTIIKGMIFLVKISRGVSGGREDTGHRIVSWAPLTLGG
jgi:hypothetical protein